MTVKLEAGTSMVTQSETLTSISKPRPIAEAIVEIVGDSGEGAQTAGQTLGIVSARMGCGVWTVEIIPAEIEPPARSPAGASGSRVRMGTHPITNMGDMADVVMAMNEQVLYSRIDKDAFREGTQIFIESKWGSDSQESIRNSYAEALADFRNRGFIINEVAMEQECLRHVDDARKGKNVWILGLLCAIYDRDLSLAKEEIEGKLVRKGRPIVEQNLNLLNAGYQWGLHHLEFRYSVPAEPKTTPMVVMNGNQAIALGAMAAGFEVCSMYPITPATSASHFLASSFQEAGGFLHQAEDEIAAIGFAIGASYAGKTALTITSGPGLALKTEFIGLAVMAEVPLVIVDVQRGGPSTGLPTRVEQSDLLAALHASPGDAPKIILAPSTIEECFNFMITARKLAETFRCPVIVLTDANLATGIQPFPRPELREDWLASPFETAPWDPKVRPYDWDSETGLSQRPIPGQKGGQYTLTGLAHDEESHVAYVSKINQFTHTMRSRKMRTLERSLQEPMVNGESEGDLLVVGWGSTRGAIEEAVERVRGDGLKVSSLQLRVLSPLEPGLINILSAFKRVITVEINFSDEPEIKDLLGSGRRYAQLARVLRSHTFIDIDCFSMVHGAPFSPIMIEEEIRRRLSLPLPDESSSDANRDSQYQDNGRNHSRTAPTS
jgi:2-oxoglutarate ferredoxin oxidoreductase subunit alpha